MRRIGREVTEGGREREAEMGKSLHNSKLLSATHRSAKGIKISGPYPQTPTPLLMRASVMNRVPLGLCVSYFVFVCVSAALFSWG